MAQWNGRTAGIFSASRDAQTWLWEQCALGPLSAPFKVMKKSGVHSRAQWQKGYTRATYSSYDGYGPMEPFSLGG